ncbi:MAG: hypothetical protein ACFFCS_15745 [Candidatus Hodarchaeota archaeon]
MGFFTYEIKEWSGSRFVVETFESRRIYCLIPVLYPMLIIGLILGIRKPSPFLVLFSLIMVVIFSFPFLPRSINMFTFDKCKERVTIYSRGPFSSASEMVIPFWEVKCLRVGEKDAYLKSKYRDEYEVFLILETINKQIVLYRKYGNELTNLYDALVKFLEWNDEYLP